MKASPEERRTLVVHMEFAGWDLQIGNFPNLQNHFPPQITFPACNVRYAAFSTGLPCQEII